MGCGCEGSNSADESLDLMRYDEETRRYTIRDAARDVATGQVQWAAPSQQKARLARCDEPCPALKEHRIHRLRKCGECGCFVELAVRFAKKECPLDRWPK